MIILQYNYFIYLLVHDLAFGHFSQQIGEFLSVCFKFEFGAHLGNVLEVLRFYILNMGLESAALSILEQNIMEKNLYIQNGMLSSKMNVVSQLKVLF